MKQSMCMYTQNNRGPRMETWGTPQVKQAKEDYLVFPAEEEASPRTTKKVCLINKI